MCPQYTPNQVSFSFLCSWSPPTPNGLCPHSIYPLLGSLSQVPLCQFRGLKEKYRPKNKLRLFLVSHINQPQLMELRRKGTSVLGVPADCPPFKYLACLIPLKPPDVPILHLGELRLLPATKLVDGRKIWDLDTGRSESKLHLRQVLHYTWPFDGAILIMSPRRTASPPLSAISSLVSMSSWSSISTK